MKRKRMVTVFLTVGVAAGLAACSSSGSPGSPAADASGSAEDFQPVTLTFGNQHPSDSFMSDLDRQICEDIETATDGRVKVELHTDSSLGDYVSVYEEVMVGSIDMAHITVPETYGAVMTASMTPYLATDFDSLKKVYSKDGFLYGEVEKTLQPLGVHSFGFFCEGFNGVGVNKALTDPAGIGSDKGVTVRVPGMDVHALAPKALGFRTSTISYSDTYTAIQTGVVEGWHAGPPNLNYLYFRDVINHYYYYQMSQEATQIIINSNKFASLLPEDQQKITEIIDKALDSTYELAAQDDQKYMDMMAEEGIEIVKFTPEEIQAFADQVRSVVWPQLAANMGKDFFQGLADSLDIDITF